MLFNCRFFFLTKTRLPQQPCRWLLVLASGSLITASCSSNEVQVALPASFVYQGDFHPSFLPDARFVIQTKQDTGQLKWTRYRWLDGRPGSDQQVAGVDSVALTKQDLRFFFSVLDSVPLMTMVNNKNRYRYTDGVMVENEVWQNGAHHRFRFWTPKKPSSEHKLVEAVLGLARRKFPLLPQKVHLESLEEYFDFGLPCEITSTRPYEVRIHGVIYGDEKWLSDLHSFLQQLPTDEPILIDMTNSRGMAWACFPVFRTFLTHHKQVIWVPSPEALTDLHQIGVPDKHIAKTIAQGQQLVQAL